MRKLTLPKILLPKLRLPRFKSPAAAAAKLAHNRLFRIGGAVVAGAAITMALGWWAWSHSSLSKLSVRTTLVNGQAEYRIGDGYPWEKVQRGMSFGEGAQLRTAAGARISLRVADGSEVRLDSDSSVALTRLTAKHIIVQVTGGEVYTRAADRQGIVFQTRASAATYQADRLAAYRVSETKDKQGVEVYNSAVSILGVNDTQIRVGQGKRYFLRSTANATTEGKTTNLVQSELAGDEFLHWNRDLDEPRFGAHLGALHDITPPELTIAEPADNARTTATNIALSGTTEETAAVRINGATAANNSGSFSSSIDLDIGENLITVEATDEAGNKTAKTLTVTRDEPADFRLTGTQTAQGISLSWTISGIDIGKGFQVIMGDAGQPVLSAKTKSVFVGASARSYIWQVFDSKQHHFRICTYDGAFCTAYSNDAAVTAPTKQQVNSWRWPR